MKDKINNKNLDKFFPNECLIKIIKKLNISKSSFAKKIGIKPSRLSNYLSKKRLIPADLIFKIIDIFKINPYFFYLEDQPIFIISEFPEKFNYDDILLAKKWLDEIMIIIETPEEKKHIVKNLSDSELISFANNLKNQFKNIIKF